MQLLLWATPPYLVHIRHEVVGHTDWVLPDLTRGVSPHWVEVPQQQDAPVLVRHRHIPATSTQQSIGRTERQPRL